MFGEELIIGSSERKVDEQYRFFMPTFTGAEPNDRVVLEASDNGFIVYPYSRFLEYHEKYSNLIKNAKSVEEVDRLHREYQEFFKKLVLEAKLDSKRRIRLPEQNTVGIAPNSIISCAGLGDGLKIEATEPKKTI